VCDRKKERISFPLRLARPLRDHARLLAAQEGVSLNHFISLAVAEKVSRLGAMTVSEASFSQEKKVDEILPAPKSKDLEA
jgi:hypothetical protein